MKYLVKTRTVEIWNHWYEIEANSSDEAIEIVEDHTNFGIRDYDEKFLYTDEEEIIEVEPLIYENKI